MPEKFEPLKASPATEQGGQQEKPRQKTEEEMERERRKNDPDWWREQK